MGQGHWEIQTHGFGTMFFHEFDQVIRVNIRTKLARIRTAPLGRIDIGIPLPVATRRVFGFPACPHAPVIKSVFLHRLRFKPEIVDLPLADRTRHVAR